MITDTHSYHWTGSINASEILSKFTKDKKYMEYPIHGKERGDYRLADLIADGKHFISIKMMTEMKERQAKEPWMIDEAFAYVFGDVIGFIFYWVGCDFWSKQAKITTFITVFLIPIGIGIYHFI